jgi:DNA-binding CsgD family transcriptional regulator
MAERATTGTVELLERSAELEALEGHLAAVRAQGHGRLVLVAGEAGIGETALVRAFCECARPSRVLWGACDALFTPRPLAPFVDIADDVAASSTRWWPGARCSARSRDRCAAGHPTSSCRGPPLGRRGSWRFEAGLEEHVARAHTNLGTGSVAVRAYALGDRHLDAGIAYCTEHDLTSWVAYMVGWRARSELDQGHWDDAGATASGVLAAPDVPPPTRITPLTVLGRLRARRGDPDAWGPLDEALELSRGMGEVQRIAPVAGARAEARWLIARDLRQAGARDVSRGPRAATRGNPAGLTARELEVVGLLAEGLRNAEIAGRLFVSEKTAAHHVSAVLRKLGVSTRSQARPRPLGGASPKDRQSSRCRARRADLRLERAQINARDRQLHDSRKENRMDLYVILRRSGWRSPDELGEAAARSKQVADDDMPDDIKWIRSYVLEEGAGSVGTVCVYEASSPEAIRKHAKLADLPVDEIIAVADTVIIRPDPQPATA